MIRRFVRSAICPRKKRTVDFAGGNQSSNGGALLLRESERDVGVCRRLAGAMPDRRVPDHIQHKMVVMVTARVTAIVCGRRGERRKTRQRPSYGLGGALARPQRDPVPLQTAPR
jgi:hypothetical protein